MRQAYTDPRKIRAHDPGRPEADLSELDAEGRPVHPGCVVYEYHRKFNPEGAEEVGRKCRSGELACVPDKQNLSKILADALAPIRERRERWARDRRRAARRARRRQSAGARGGGGHARPGAGRDGPQAGRRGAAMSHDDRQRPAADAALPARARVGDPVVIKLARFEGPLDLLLHLIKRDEIDIYDIPIAHITQQYLATLDLMRALDLEVAGEFLVMAATLMRIKAKMLLPATPLVDEEDEGDPREELVQRLIEYRQFKEAAGTLRLREDERRQLFERGLLPTEDDAGPLPLAPASLFDLLDAFNRVIARGCPSRRFTRCAPKHTTSRTRWL